MEDANRPETEIEASEDVQYKRVGLDTRLNNRVVDLRVSVICILKESLNFMSSKSDTNQPSRVQTPVCDWTPIPGVLGFTRFYRDSLSKASRRCNRVWGFRFQSQLLQRSVHVLILVCEREIKNFKQAVLSSRNHLNLPNKCVLLLISNVCTKLPPFSVQRIQTLIAI